MYEEIVARVTILNRIDQLRAQRATFRCIAPAECFGSNATFHDAGRGGRLESLVYGGIFTRPSQEG